MIVWVEVHIYPLQMLTKLTRVDWGRNKKIIENIHFGVLSPHLLLVLVEFNYVGCIINCEDCFLMY